jgi:hypothetical protein
VYGPLQTYLEKNKNFKLELHERDFDAGRTIIPFTIKEYGC